MLGLQQGLRCAQRKVSGLFFCRLLSSTASKPPEKSEEAARKAAKKRETHIALIHPDKTVTHTTLEDATKLSNRRDLKLLKVSDYDRKRDSPVYKLLTAAQYREEALSLKKSKKTAQPGSYKSEKLLPLNSKIGDHDLESKLNKIISWIEKKHEVRVSISCSKEDELPTAEKVYKKMEAVIGSQGRILQKRTSGTDVKFQVVPPKQSPAQKEAKSPQKPKSLLGGVPSLELVYTGVNGSYTMTQSTILWEKGEWIQPVMATDSVCKIHVEEGFMRLL